MGYIIDCHNEKFLLISMDSTITTPTILSAAGDLLDHPEYYSKHSLWNFSDAQLKVSLQEMYDFISLMKLFKPEKPDFANKSVLVVSGKVNYALAEMFVGMSEGLPFDYSVFSDLTEAKSYLNKLG